jgi:hypothetical protein
VFGGTVQAVGAYTGIGAYEVRVVSVLDRLVGDRNRYPLAPTQAVARVHEVEHSPRADSRPWRSAHASGIK